MLYTTTCKGSELSRKQAEILLTKGFGVPVEGNEPVLAHRLGINLLLDYVRHNGVVLGYQGNFGDMTFKTDISFEDLCEMENDKGAKFNSAVNWYKGTDGDEMFEKFKHLLRESEATR